MAWRTHPDDRTEAFEVSAVASEMVGSQVAVQEYTVADAAAERLDDDRPASAPGLVITVHPTSPTLDGIVQPLPCLSALRMLLLILPGAFRLEGLFLGGVDTVALAGSVTASAGEFVLGIGSIG